MPLLLVLALSAAPVDAAMAHLKAGQLDDVLFDLEGKPLSAAEKPEAVKVLAAASKAALDAKDVVLADHLASMALKLEPGSTAALEAAARASFAQQQFGDAERHADAWVKADPKGPAARMLRAELAAEAGEWDLVLQHLQAGRLDTPAARALEARAKREQEQKVAAMSELASLQRKLDEAARQRPPPSSTGVRPMVRTSDVVLYGTSWCGYCKKARDWLTRKGVSFIERDIEKDPDAAMELARKAQAAGVRPGGVPVIDVRGRLVLGFDPKQIQDAL